MTFLLVNGNLVPEISSPGNFVPTEVIKGEGGGVDEDKVLSVFEEEKNEKRVTQGIQGEEGY